MWPAFSSLYCSSTQTHSTSPALLSWRCESVYTSRDGWIVRHFTLTLSCDRILSCTSSSSPQDLTSLFFMQFQQLLLMWPAVRKSLVSLLPCFIHQILRVHWAVARCRPGKIECVLSVPYLNIVSWCQKFRLLFKCWGTWCWFNFLIYYILRCYDLCM